MMRELINYNKRKNVLFSIIINMANPLRDNQKSVIERMINCAEHGLLIYHTMGSGKTFIGVAYMANFYKENKLIIVPKGVDVPWKKELKDTGLSTSIRECKIPFQQTAEPTLPGGGCVIYKTYDDLKIMPANEFLQIAENSIVCCDEAHLLVPILRGSNASAIRTGLKKAKKVLLLTGTPIQTGFGDLGVLINIG